MAEVNRLNIRAAGVGGHLVRFRYDSGDVTMHSYLRYLITVLSLLVIPIAVFSSSIPADMASIPDVFVSVYFGNKPFYALIVEKSSQQLYLYECNGRSYRKISRFNCSTGEQSGPKMESGDQKTPEGVYFFPHRYNKKYLTPVYGSRAFPIDYPNSFDRYSGRSGYSIWMHGTHKKLKPHNTNGCIVLRNEDIDRLDRFIALKSTPIIIVDRIVEVPMGTNDSLNAAAYETLMRWKKALSDFDRNSYLALYGQDYSHPMSWWDEWAGIKKQFPGSGPIEIELDLKTVFKYKQTVVVVFGQAVKCMDLTAPVGIKKLFLARRSGRFEIVGEEYLDLAGTVQDSGAGQPLISVGRHLSEILRMKQNGDIGENRFAIEK